VQLQLHLLFDTLGELQAWLSAQPSTLQPLQAHPSPLPAEPGPDALKQQRQAQAANARAAKAAKQADPPMRVSGGQATAAVDVAGPADGTNGTGDQDDDSDAMGLNAPSMSPGEAKDAALALVREVYSAGHVAQVKALQKELDVAKFYDVPVEKGHVFYQRVMKLAQGVGLRQ
jgi:hypothetical protein